MKLVWVLKWGGRSVIWGTFREAWSDYFHMLRFERELMFKVILFPKLMRNVKFENLPEHQGW